MAFAGDVGSSREAGAPAVCDSFVTLHFCDDGRNSGARRRRRARNHEEQEPASAVLAVRICRWMQERTAVMPSPKTAQDILVTELKEIHSAERQFSRAAPKMIRKISSETFKSKLEERRERGAQIIEEIDNILEAMEVTKARPKNVAAEGLLEDISEHLEQIEKPVLLDATLIASVQKLEHYCLAAWGTAKSLGRLLGQEQVVQLMERVLDEGKRFDEELTQLAESEVNPAMVEDSEGEESEEKRSKGKSGK
jgi:ferritin-like metal-binding protein YciE